MGAEEEEEYGNNEEGKEVLKEDEAEAAKKLEYANEQFRILAKTPFALSMLEDELSAYQMGQRNVDGTYEVPEFRWKLVFGLCFFNMIVLSLANHLWFSVVLLDYEWVISNWWFDYWPAHYCKFRGDFLAKDFDAAIFFWIILEFYLWAIVAGCGGIFVDKITTLKFTYKRLLFYVAARFWPTILIREFIVKAVACRVPEGSPHPTLIRDPEDPGYNVKEYGKDAIANQPAACTIAILIIVLHFWHSTLFWFVDIYLYNKVSNGRIEKLYYALMLVVMFGNEIWDGVRVFHDWSGHCPTLGTEYGYLRYYAPDEHGFFCVPFWGAYSDDLWNTFLGLIDSGAFTYPSADIDPLRQPEMLKHNRQWCGTERYDLDTGMGDWRGNGTWVDSYDHAWGRANVLDTGDNPPVLAAPFLRQGAAPFYIFNYQNICALFLLFQVFLGGTPSFVLRNWAHGSKGQFGDIVIYADDSDLIQRPREFSQYCVWMRHVWLTHFMLLKFETVMAYNVHFNYPLWGIVRQLFPWFFRIVWFTLLKLMCFLGLRTGLGRNNYLPLMLPLQFAEGCLYMFNVYSTKLPFSVLWITELALLIVLFSVRDLLFQPLTRAIFLKFGWMDDGILEELVFNEEACQWDSQTSFCNLLAAIFVLVYALFEIMFQTLQTSCYASIYQACSVPSSERFVGWLVSCLIVGLVCGGILKVNLNRLDRQRKNFVSSNHHNKLDHSITVSWEKAHDWVPRCIYFPTMKAYVKHQSTKMSFILIFIVGLLIPVFKQLILLGMTARSAELEELKLKYWLKWYLTPGDMHFTFAEL